MLKWILTAMATLGLLFFMSGGISIPTQSDPDLRVEKPSLLGVEAYAQEAGVNFLQQEAGIAGYIQMEQELDLGSIRELFKTVESVSDQYIIGEIALENLPDYAHPHLYVNQDGWLVAYYSNSVPASKTIQWIGYKGKGMPDTTLRNAIGKIYESIQLPPPNRISYYNFEYPEANRIMLITKLASKNNTSKSFFLTIPRQVKLREAAWSYYHSGDAGGNSSMNGEGLAGGSRTLEYGDLTERVEIQKRHKFHIRNGSNNYGDSGTTRLGLVLIYQSGQ